MRALMVHWPSPVFSTPLMVYLSSLSGLSCPSFRRHQCPLITASVRVDLNLASRSAADGAGLADSEGGTAFSFGSCAKAGAMANKMIRDVTVAFIKSPHSTTTGSPQ